MSFNEEKISCAVCKAYLFEEDDIVYCPECGAPHHRECYNSVGKCGLEHLHGTPNQYERKKPATTDEIKNQEQKAHNTQDKKTCPHCMKKIDIDSRVCPYCARPSMSGVYVNFDLFGGVPRDTDIGNSVTAEMAREFVSVNSQRYIPKFLSFKEGKKLSWNWLAFLFPEGWFLSRKMYKAGALVITVLIALQIFLFPLTAVLNQNIFANYDEVTAFLMQYTNESLASGQVFPIVLAFIGSLGTIVVRFIAALFGDRIYYNHVLERVDAFSKSDLEKEDYLRKYGGVNLFGFLLGILAINNLPNIIFAFFM